MTPLKALRTLEVAAARILDGPQADQQVRDALEALRHHVQRWWLDYLWLYLQFDAKSGPTRIVGVQQNLSAALNGIAGEMRTTRLDPVQLAEAISEQQTEK